MSALYRPLQYRFPAGSVSIITGAYNSFSLRQSAAANYITLRIT